MKSQLLNINSFFERIPDLVKKRRLMVWLIFILITAAAMAGIPRFRIDMSWNNLLKADEPVKIAYDRFRAVFGSDEVLYLVYEAKDGNVFSGKSLDALLKLQNEIESKIGKPTNDKEKHLSHITDITSLINASYLEGGKDHLVSRDFVGLDIPKNQKESDYFKKSALEHPDYPLILCSKDSRYAGIIIRTDFNAEIDHGDDQPGKTKSGEADFEFESGSDGDYKSPLEGSIPKFKAAWIQDYVPFMQSIYGITAKDEYSRHLKFHPAGNPELMAFLGIELEKEMGIIILGSLVLILIVLGILFRSFSAVLWPLVIVAATLIWTIGLIGWTRTSMTDFINIIIFLLIAVGVADAVHILSGYKFFTRKGEDHHIATRSVYKKSGVACFLTSITTATGLLALTFAPIISVQRLAVFGAAGVIFAFLITVFMLPVMLDILKPKVRKPKKPQSNSEPKVQKILARFDRFATQRQGFIKCLFVVIGAALIPGLFMIEVNSNVLTIIRESEPIRKNFDVVDQNMTGTGNIEILVDTGVTDGIKDPLVMKAMGSFQKDLEDNISDIVYKTQSLVNVARNSYQVLNEGRKEMYLIPDDPDELAQTLFLFSTANPKDRRLLVADDYRAARIIVNTRNVGSQEGLGFMEEVNQRVNRHFSEVKAKYPKFRIESTGQIPMFLRMMDLISWSQIQSFAIGLVLISVMLLFLAGNIKTGILAIIPNFFPILTVFGFMGWAGIPLDVHTLLVVPIIIGISVDDTIHFITHYSIEKRKGKKTLSAISLAIREAGQAIVFTSIVLAIGYLVFLVCVNKGFAYFGFLSSLAVLTALIADLVLLPALLSPKTAKSQNA